VEQVPACRDGAGEDSISTSWPSPRSSLASFLCSSQTRSGTRRMLRHVRGINHVDNEYNDVEVASVDSAVKRQWRACPRLRT
jgi:hypothetical protein